jgi:hypothetical protein
MTPLTGFGKTLASKAGDAEFLHEGATGSQAVALFVTAVRYSNAAAKCARRASSLS